MQSLRVVPCLPVAIAPQVLHNKPWIARWAGQGIRVPEPKAFGIFAHQIKSARHQFRRSDLLLLF